MRQLPNKMSDLIEVALEDLTKVEADQRYRVRMNDWHVPPHSGETRCAVCFAGAVMAKSLDAAIASESFPDDYEEDTGRKLSALDQVRVGWVSEALRIMHEDADEYHAHEELNDFRVVSYAEDPARWREDMVAIVARLREEGL